MPDVAISWYHSSTCCAITNIVPGDRHGPMALAMTSEFWDFSKKAAEFSAASQYFI